MLEAKLTEPKKMPVSCVVGFDSILIAGGIDTKDVMILELSWEGELVVKKLAEAPFNFNNGWNN